MSNMASKIVPVIVLLALLDPSCVLPVCMDRPQASPPRHAPERALRATGEPAARHLLHARDNALPATGATLVRQQ